MTRATDPQPLFSDGALTVHSLQPGDIDLIARWRADPEVSDVWGPPQDADALRAEFAAEPEVHKGLARWEGQPIGFQQWYPLEPTDLDEYRYPRDRNVWGVDQFIGSGAHRDRGLGTRQVRATARYLLDDVGAELVVTDPAVTNERAIRAYEKAGFRRVRVLPRHEEIHGVWTDNWQMEFVDDRGR
jgi:aminoglycoside 6'-N-acetyltransferase